MKILEDRQWPEELRAELKRQIDAAAPEDVLRAAGKCPAVGRGFRLDKTNLPRFRRGLVVFAESNLSDEGLDMLRWCTVWKDIVCVLSVKALTDGFDAMAAFVGGARLLVGMLVDPREEVRRRALAELDSGRPLPPVPDDPEAARELLAETFEPFVRLFSSATVAPQITRIDRSDEDHERIRALAEQTAALTAERAAESQARREAERVAEAAVRDARRAETDAEQARAEAAAARDAARDAEARLAAALSDSAALRDELLRVRNDLRTLQAFQDECFRLRPRVTQLAADNDALRAEADALRARVAELESDAPADGRELLREHLAAPVPEKPRATPRDRLSEMARPGPLPASRPLHLVIDGHNVLNVAPEYVSMATTGDDPPSHEELRADLERRVIALASRLAPCEVDLHFDGPVANLYNPAPGVRVRFSGGFGAHRAAQVVLDELAFYIPHEDAAFVTVTEDKDLALDALELGSFTVRSGDFSQLLFVP